MANIRGTTGSILGTVTSAASAATTLITTAEQATQLLANRVQHSLNEQQDRLKVEARDNRQRLMRESAEANSLAQFNLAKKLSQSPELAAAYAAEYAAIEELLK